MKNHLFSIFLMITLPFLCFLGYLTNFTMKETQQNVFSNEMNQLLAKGYSKEQINEIYEFMNKENIEWLLKEDYIDLDEFTTIPNFQVQKYNRYQAYRQLSNLSLDKVVTYVNLNLDQDFYTDITEIKNPTDTLALVNKYHKLPADYVPEDLVSIPSFPNLKLRNVAIDSFEQLLAAAKLDGIMLVPYSTYRSYDYQKGLYEKYLQTDPVNIVDTYSARPGHSEHQTGLAIDIRSATHWYNLTDEDYLWMQNNSYQYGFIIRYTKSNEKITGYKEEPWHIRYIGVEHATKVHELNITFDEYYDLYIANKKEDEPLYNSN